MSSEEEEKCWKRGHWVMCKAEPHGILVAELGSHLLIPEVSNFGANFTIRRCTVAGAHQAQEQSDICKWMKGNIPHALLDPTQSKGHLSIMCSCLGTTEETMLGNVLLSGMPFTQGHMLLTVQNCWVSQRACLCLGMFFYNISDWKNYVIAKGTGIPKSLT